MTKQDHIDALRADKPQLLVNVRLWLTVAAEVFPPSCYRDELPCFVLRDGELMIVNEYRGRKWRSVISEGLLNPSAMELRRNLIAVRDGIDRWLKAGQ